MTAETEVYKGETVEACDLDMSSYEDLRKGGGECNGVSHEGEEGVIGNGKGDSDCSYVFVTGKDVVSDDYAGKDLNVEFLPEPDHPKDEIDVQAGILRIHKGENDQLHDAEDCCDVEGTVVSSSNDRYMQVESTDILVLEGDSLQESNSEVDAESEPTQPDVVITEDQTNLGSGAEEQTGLEEQNGSGSGAEEQNGSGSGAEERTGSGPGAEKHTGLGSAAEEHRGLRSGAVEHTDPLSSAEEHTDLGSGAEEHTDPLSGAEEHTGPLSSAEEHTDLGSGAEEHTDPLSGAEEHTGPLSSAEEHTDLRSGAEEHSDPGSGVEGHTDLGSVVEEHTDPGSGVEEQTSLGSGLESASEKQTSVQVGSEKTDPEPSTILVGKAQSQIVVPEAVQCELMHPDNENPKVDGHINSKAPEEIAGSWEFPVPVLETDEQKAIESIAEVRENQGFEAITNADECYQHQFNNVHEKVPELSEPVSVTVAHDNQESEINVFEGLPFDKNGEMQASELEDDLPPEGPPVELGLNLEHDLEMPSTKINMQPEAEVSVGCVLDENGNGLPVESSTSEIEAANDCHQIQHELYVSSENDRSLSSYSDCLRSESTAGYEPLQKEESLPTGLDNGPTVEQENVVPFPGDGTNSEREAENGHCKDDTTLACSCTNVRVETIISFGSIRFPCGDGNAKPHASEVAPICSSCEPAIELKDSVENGSNLPTSAEVKSESEAENTSSLSYKDVVSKTCNIVDAKIEGDHVGIKDITIENEGCQITSLDSDDKLTCQEAGSALGNGTSSSLEVLSPDALDSQNVPAEAGKRPFYFLIRVPRYDDEKIREEIKLAQLQVDEKTKSRDAIRSEIQIKRTVCKEYNENFEAALSEERAARELLKAKFQEVDSVQSLINRVKNAMSVRDIDGRIRHMEHAIEHETLPLKEEKQLIRDIKQLRNVREQLSSNMGKQEEVQQALDQKSQVEEQAKILKEEMDSLRNKVQKAEVITKAAKKKYYDETEKLNVLLGRFKDADNIRQEAYAHLQNLRKKLSEKNKYFRMYKDDLKAANDYASAGDKETLQQLCVNEVETIMELWNNNDEFRKEYIRCNTRSTLRRLRTLDGRSLGPDEEPPVLPNSLNDVGRSFYVPAKGSSAPIVSTVEQIKQMTPAEAEKTDDKSMVKVSNRKNQTGKNKDHMKLATGGVSATISGRDEIEETKEEEHKQTKEEEELTRRAEELRKKEEAAKLKEQRRLEEKAKAKEALERKKRNAEKAQVRAELRAQKEAEQKQRERVKKARKKERKNASSAEATHGCNEAESAPSSETLSESTLDSESIEKPRTISKTPQKPSQFTKQNKSKSIPPPIRNRGKRRIQSWVWVLLIALLALALFLLGNTGLSSSLGLQSFGF